MDNDFPGFSNFYSSISNPSKIDLKELFENNGWKIRKSSWEDFECLNEFSELNLVGDESNLLLTGIIKSPELNYDLILDLLKSIGAKFNSELYDENKIIVRSDNII